MPLLLPLERSWLKNTQLVDIEPALSPYLLETQSLTARLKETCERFSVTVLANEFRCAPDALRTELSEQAWCREVTLNCNGKAVVFGQSWLNEEACIVGMDAIGETPLGELLFTDLNWQRGALEYFRLSTSDYPALIELITPTRNIPESLFARRSWFKNGKAKILVCEVFISESFYD
ncbi:MULTISPECIES: chorismate--pyruvate lyase family protein [Pseudoalteromonas]|uniref:chorismate--pyruvate lyase family protein n=1 Tax=Pseudoalteromonas TaxID=53246 RepID=UPI00110860A3|nr:MULTISPECIES: chorismate lyase [Pseudoalteromonas]MCG9758460.1 chorismate lyase [Pseudoalteromonas sp. Isolate6]NKC19741.1 chorismate lyase [Pseudoalteromonas galatheae]